MPAPIADWIWPILAGPFVGSFLGVLIRRLPRRRPLVLDRSRCESCGKALGPGELVPLLSFLWLRGRCRSCAAPIGRFHVAVELAALLVPLGAILANSTDVPLLWIDCSLGWGLLALGWIDWEHLLLPDVLTLPLAVAGLSMTYLGAPMAIGDHAIAAGIGFSSLWCVNAGYRWLRGRDGLGGGDAKLFAACGAWMGLSWLGPILLTAALVGIGIALVRHRTGEPLRRDMRLPLGTCLAFSLWTAWLLSVGMPAVSRT